MLQVSSSSNEIMNYFSHETLCFEQMLDELQEFKVRAPVNSYTVKPLPVEPKIGRVKIDFIKRKVDKKLTALSQSNTIPNTIDTLLKKYWSRVMSLAYLKDNDKDWSEACKVAENLVYSTQPASSIRASLIIEMRSPVILEAIKVGLEKVITNSIRISKILESISEIHQTSIKVTQKKWLNPEGNNNGHDDNNPEIHEYSSAGNNIKPIEGHPTIAITDSEMNAMKEYVEIQIKHHALIKDFNVGGLFELNIKGKLMRCKLSSLIISKQVYVFVNRFGIKIAEYNITKLADESMLERIKKIESDPLFERTFKSSIERFAA